MLNTNNFIKAFGFKYFPKYDETLETLSPTIKRETLNAVYTIVAKIDKRTILSILFLILLDGMFESAVMRGNKIEENPEIIKNSGTANLAKASK